MFFVMFLFIMLLRLVKVVLGFVVSCENGLVEVGGVFGFVL